MPCVRKRGNAKTDIQEVPFRHRKHFFTVRLTEHWHRWPREVVEFPSFEIFHLGTVLGNGLCLTLLEKWGLVR